MPSLARGTLLVLVTAWGCRGSGYGSGTDTMSMPAPTGAAASATVVVTIAGQKTAMSFDPNPASIAQRTMVVWHNTDTTPHRIVMNDGSFDSGDIMPGSSSPALRLSSTGGVYHCTIHPTTMSGSIDVVTISGEAVGPPY